MPPANRKIGIIGLGFGAQVYIPAFRSEGWEVAAVCGRNRDKTAKVADEMGVHDVHANPKELIARDDLDAVAIATPPRGNFRAGIKSGSPLRPLLFAGPVGLADASNRSGRRPGGAGLRSRKQKDPDQQTCCKCPEAQSAS